uniref:Uncharacterized protein n=1 Tax=Anguilla anguilla TaxID=7936 RepID=A0A0E9Q611_ANGAN
MGWGGTSPAGYPTGDLCVRVSPQIELPKHSVFCSCFLGPCGKAATEPYCYYSNLFYISTTFRKQIKNP